MLKRAPDGALFFHLPSHLPETPIPSHECLQHVRDQRHSIGRLAIRLHVQRGVTVEVGFQAALRGAAARDAVEAVGACLLFLPPYNPDFNPIENIFSKMKAWIRGGPEGIVHLVFTTRRRLPSADRTYSIQCRRRGCRNSRFQRKMASNFWPGNDA